MVSRVSEPGVPSDPRIEWRLEDHPLQDDEATLVRMHIDDLNRVMNMSLRWWPVYRDVLIHLGRPGAGALALSVFVVTNEWPLERIVAASHQKGFRTASWGTLREAGYDLWPTDLWLPDGRDQRSEVHYDVVLEVADAPPAGIDAGSAERKAARRRMAPLFERALDLFGPVIEL